MLSVRSIPLRYFTPQEANELIPTVRAYLFKIREHGQVLLALERTLEQTIGDEQRHALEATIGNRALAQAHLLDRLDELGAELIDPLEMGRVRFPALRNGEPVWLVWHVGEPRVERWTPIGSRVFGPRKVDEGFSVRWEWKN